FSYEQVARGIDHHAEGGQHGERGGSAVARQADGAVAAESSDHALRVHGANRTVSGIGDENAAIGADGDTLRVGKAGEGGRAGIGAGGDASAGGAGVVIAVPARVSRAGKEVDEAVGSDHADGVIGGYRAVDLPRGVHREGL